MSLEFKYGSDRKVIIDKQNLDKTVLYKFNSKELRQPDLMGQKVIEIDF